MISLVFFLLLLLKVEIILAHTPPQKKILILSTVGKVRLFKAFGDIFKLKYLGSKKVDYFIIHFSTSNKFLQCRNFLSSRDWCCFYVLACKANFY